MYHNTRKLSIHVEITNMQWLVNKWEFYFGIVLIFEKLRNLICSMNLPRYLPISFVNCACGKLLSHVRLFATLWTVAHQAPLSMRVSRQEYWSGLPCTPPGDFPTPGSNPGLLHCWEILYRLSHHGSPRILEWVAYPFARRSSQPRNLTGVSWIS